MEKCARSQDAFLKVEFLGTPILLENKTINEWHQYVFIMTSLIINTDYAQNPLGNSSPAFIRITSSFTNRASLFP